MPGELYIVATPIGNLGDITLRAIKVLSEVDIILAEDTRVTQKLTSMINAQSQMLNGAKRPQLISYHQHSSDTKKLEILNYLNEGKNMALVTDAGTPGISDPGNELIDFLKSHSELVSESAIKIVPIPGVSAITAALSISGFDVSKFIFLGFLPKKKLQKSLNILVTLKLPFVYYDSPFRVIKNLEKLNEVFPNAKIVVARELTKLYETIYRGTISEVLEQLKKSKVKGEVTIIVDPLRLHIKGSNL